MILLFFLLNLCFPFRLEVEYSQLVTDRDGKILHAYLSPDDKWRMYATLDEITPELATAIIWKEDKNFRRHPGVDPLALSRAAWRNLITGRRTSGASTIPMQVIRLLEPRPRTYKSKIIEMFRATQLSMLYSKDEVLQLYLNLVPYGGNIEGVKAASLLYLGKTPEQLSLAEITALSVVPNRPGSLRPGAYNSAIIESRNEWLDYFASNKVFDQDLIEIARLEPFEPVRRPAPAFAPHWSQRMRSISPAEQIISSSLDFEKQQLTEQTLQRHHRRLRQQEIHNLSAVVLDNRSGEIVAYVGSADFSDALHSGQVDGLTALRSPGSTLKPLLFAMAMDSGMITPATVLLDVPTEFSGYRPRNFDRSYRGKVTVSDAIASSLNVPAVRMLDEFGVERFRSRLASCGTPSMTDQQGRLGLSMVLGGCGIRPIELASLYQAIANEGMHRVPRARPGNSTDTSRLFSPQTAWALADMLTGLQRPDLPKGYEYALDRIKIGWKTGTSYGRRDGWSVGFSRDYTILVWAGNFSGQGIPELTGAGIATPILFDLFQAVDKTSRKAWFPVPQRLNPRFVCPETGLPPSPDCPHEVMDQYIPLVSPSATCAHIAEIRIAQDSSKTYCSECLPESGWRRALYPDLPSELRDWYDSEGIAYRAFPPHNPSCDKVFAGAKPSITSPVEGLTYFDYPGAGKLRLACQVPAEVSEVHWYLNDEFIGSGSPAEDRFVEMSPGSMKISCADDKGRHSDVWIKVEAL